MLHYLSLCVVCIFLMPLQTTAGNGAFSSTCKPLLHPHTVLQSCRGGRRSKPRLIEKEASKEKGSFQRGGMTIMAWWRRHYTSSDNGKKSVGKKGVGKSSANRLEKELSSFLSERPCNCTVTIGKSIQDWTVEFIGAEGSVFEGETYRLKMIFPTDYPSKPPRVFFLKPTPKHQHVYSNGDICMNLLGTDWRPNLTAETLVVSIISMLASAKEKKLPIDNSLHAGSQPGAGEQLNWMYHDDNC